MTKYKDVFDFYEKFNHFLHKANFFGIELKENDFQGGSIIGIFAKSLTTFQSIYILFKHYFCNNAENLCRILFEEMVNISYCSLGKDETRRYLSLQVINKLKLINTVNQKENKKYFTENDKEIFFKDKTYNEWKNELISYLHSLGVKEIFDKEGDPVAINLEERIKKVNSKSIMHYYLTFYRIVSAGVHSSPDILERYFIFDENRLMKELYWGPKAENCEINSIFAAIHFMIINLEYIHNYFGHPEKEDISYFWKKIQELGCKYHYFDQNINNKNQF